MSESAEELSERWQTRLAQAHKTINVTAQNFTRSALLPITRRYYADWVFEKPLLRGDFYTGTRYGRKKQVVTRW